MTESSLFSFVLVSIEICLELNVLRLQYSSFIILLFSAVRLSFIHSWLNIFGKDNWISSWEHKLGWSSPLSRPVFPSLSLAPSQSCERHQTAHWIEHLSFLLFPLPLVWFYQCFAALLCVFTHERFKDSLQRSLLMISWYHCERHLDFSCWFLWHINKSVI